MALPLQKLHTEQLQSQIYSFFWTKQREGITVCKRTLVSRKRVHASHAMGGLQVPMVQDTVTGLHQNLVQKLHKQITADMPSICASHFQEVLIRVHRPTLNEHVTALGPIQWLKTATQLEAHNAIFAASFRALATLLQILEKIQKPGTWHPSLATPSWQATHSQIRRTHY